MALLGALGHLANIGQFVEIGQGHAHQKEQIRWSHRNYRLDVQALKIDLLGAARDDVRGTYDTYIERLDTLLLVNALLLPFALSTLQFSDQFVPQTEAECRDDCFEVRNPWIVTLWVYLVGWSVIMPFWSLLLLLWCKMRMDHWLQHTLAELQNLRRDIITRPGCPNNSTTAECAGTENAYQEHEEIVTLLGRFIVDYQDCFTELWTAQCAPLVVRATQLLLLSVCGSVLLVGVMFWIFLVNRHGEQSSSHIHFAWVMVLGLTVPAAFYVYQRWRNGRFIPDRSLITRRSSNRECGHQSPLARTASCPSPNSTSAVVQCDLLASRRAALARMSSEANARTLELLES